AYRFLLGHDLRAESLFPDTPNEFLQSRIEAAVLQRGNSSSGLAVAWDSLPIPARPEEAFLAFVEPDGAARGKEPQTEWYQALSGRYVGGSSRKHTSRSEAKAAQRRRSGR